MFFDNEANLPETLCMLRRSGDRLFLRFSIAHGSEAKCTHFLYLYITSIVWGKLSTLTYVHWPDLLDPTLTQTLSGQENMKRVQRQFGFGLAVCCVSSFKGSIIPYQECRKFHIEL